MRHVSNSREVRLRRWAGLVLAALTVALAAGVVAMTAGLSRQEAVARQPATPPLKVVATTAMIADAARAIGGDAVEIRALMGPGVDPHAYRQTRSDIVAMVKADLVLWNGLYLEAQMEEFFADLGKRSRVVAVGEAVPTERRLAHEDYVGRYDPHLWMDPQLWAIVVEAIRDEMTAAAPAHGELFRRNAEVYLSSIDDTARYARSALSSVAQDQRVLVTAHDAFNYFGRAYGFEVVGIQGISTESEAGLKRIRDLVDMIVARDIKAVFVETSVSERNIRAVIEGAAARGHAVAVGGELFSDAMGQPGTYEGTYVGMIDHNATVITRALGGDAPAAGGRGRLSVTG